MPRVTCAKCGGSHPSWECLSPPREEVVPHIGPQASASTRRRDRKSAPSDLTGGSPTELSDEELVPYYNEYMRRKMQRRRKAKK